MNKKVVIGAIIILLLIIIAYCALRPKEMVYSDNPEDWIDEKPNDTMEVNFEQVTKGAGTFNEINEQYKYALIDAVFGFDGIYEGEFFKNKYYGPNGSILMEITKDLVLNDGILQGVIAERIDDAQPIAFIFLDEDWKDKFGNSVNIVWGATYQNSMPFEYVPVANGIYMTPILDDPGRFPFTYNDAHLGGIVVGNVNANDIKEGKTDGKTIIMLS